MQIIKLLLYSRNREEEIQIVKVRKHITRMDLEKDR